MTAPSMDICSPWCTDADMPCDVSTFDAAVLADAQLVASEVLYNLTLQRWPGECERTVRPCASFASPDTRRHYPSQRWLGGGGISNGLAYGAWWTGGPLSMPVCTCADQHQVGCFWLSQITLGAVPLSSIVEVRIDGAVVDAARYRIDDFRWLVWVPDQTGTDPRQGWPCCQRMELPPTEDNTFEVKATIGSLPDRGGVRSAASYACELAKAWTPGQTCALPKRATAMTRQQMTMQLSDPSALLVDGLLGLPDVDAWVQSTNYAARRRHGAIVVPERRRQTSRRTTS